MTEIGKSKVRELKWNMKKFKGSVLHFSPFFLQVASKNKSAKSICLQPYLFVLNHVQEAWNCLYASSNFLEIHQLLNYQINK